VNESNKKAILGIAAAIAIGAAATGIAYFAGEGQAYVAKVDGTSIKSTEYDKIYAQTKKQYESRFGIDFASEQGKAIEKDIKKGLVNQLVERQIILNEAAKRHVQVTDADIDAKLAEIKKGFPNDDAFQKALKDNNMTLDELKGRVREGLTIEGVQKAVGANVAVTDKDVQDYYDKNKLTYQKPEEVRASHILIKDEKKAKEILAKLQKGEDFAKLAKENSEDPGSGAQGGDLGYFGKGRMVPEFEKASFSLKPGQMSGLVKSQFGYHIIKVVDHHGPRTQPFDEVKAEIKDKLTKERQGAEFGKWLQGEKAKAKVEYKAEFDPATLAAPPAGAPGAPGAPGAAPAPAGQAPAGQPAGQPAGKPAEGDKH
jgi:parvulin-like peptidyl-prolyl isomerase